jgi:hypothetical protein
MTRTAVSAFLLGVLLLAAPAAAQGPDEAAKLRREVEQLKKENDLLARENALLRKELEQFKAAGSKDAAKAPDDGLGVGAKLAGTVGRTWLDDKGKRVTVGNAVDLEVTRRSGKSFTAETWWDNRKSGMEVEGTVDGRLVTFRSTKALGGGAKEDLVGLHTFTGVFEKGVLTGRTTKRGDPSYSGKWDLKKKE